MARGAWGARRAVRMYAATAGAASRVTAIVTGRAGSVTHGPRLGGTGPGMEATGLRKRWHDGPQGWHGGCSVSRRRAGLCPGRDERETSDRHDGLGAADHERYGAGTDLDAARTTTVPAAARCGAAGLRHHEAIGDRNDDLRVAQRHADAQRDHSARAG